MSRTSQRLVLQPEHTNYPLVTHQISAARNPAINVLTDKERYPGRIYLREVINMHIKVGA